MKGAENYFKTYPDKNGFFSKNTVVPLNFLQFLEAEMKKITTLLFPSANLITLFRNCEANSQQYQGRPYTCLLLAYRLSEKIGGRIMLKREDP